MSSGNSNSTTTTTRLEIPSWLEGNMQRVAQDAQSLYTQGVGPQYYPGQTWINQDPYTAQANNLQAGLATNNPLNGIASGSLQNIMYDRGVAPGTAPAIASVGNIASGANQVGTGGQFQRAIDSLPSGGLAYGTDVPMQWLNQIASGNNAIDASGLQGLSNSVPSGGLATGTDRPLGLLGNIAGGQNAIDVSRLQNLGAMAGTGGGLAAGTGGALDRIEATGSGANAIEGGTYKGILGGLAGGNPNFQAALDYQLGKAADQIKSAYSGAGRYGSGAMAQNMAEGLGGMRAQALANQWNQDRAQELQAAAGLAGVQGQNLQNMLGANQALFQNRQGAGQQAFQNQLAAEQAAMGGTAQNIGNQLNASQGLFGNLQGAQGQGFGQRLSAEQAMAGIRGQNIGNILGASQSAFGNLQGAQQADTQNRLGLLNALSNVQGANIGAQSQAGQYLGGLYQNAQQDAMRAAGMAPAIAASQYDDIGRLREVGGMNEALQAQQLNDAIARYEFMNRQPWNQLGMYAQSLQGINAGGTQTQIAQRPQMSPLQGALGGGLLGASVGSAVPGIGTGLGALGGGLLGGLGSLIRF